MRALIKARRGLAAAALATVLSVSARAQVLGPQVGHKSVGTFERGPIVRLDDREMGALHRLLRGGGASRERGFQTGTIERRRSGNLVVRLDSIVEPEDGKPTTVIREILVAGPDGRAEAVVTRLLYPASCGRGPRCEPLTTKGPARASDPARVARDILDFFGISARLRLASHP